MFSVHPKPNKKVIKPWELQYVRAECLQIYSQNLIADFLREIAFFGSALTVPLQCLNSALTVPLMKTHSALIFSTLKKPLSKALFFITKM